MKALLRTPVGIGIDVVFYTCAGAVLVSLWDWFVIPLFTGAPDLNIGYAVGLMLIASMVTSDMEPPLVDDDSSPWENMFLRSLYRFLTIGVVFTYGWVVQGLL